MCFTVFFKPFVDNFPQECQIKKFNFLLLFQSLFMSITLAINVFLNIEMIIVYLEVVFNHHFNLGLKIKEIRERTGALIITPGESEDHVFIIEALPKIALTVAKLIKERSSEITMNRQRENNQKASLLLNISNRFGIAKPHSTMSSFRPILATGVIEVPKVYFHVLIILFFIYHADQKYYNPL